MTKDPEQSNEYYLRLGGKANIPEPLEIGNNYSIKAQGTITSFTESDLNDGRHVVYYKFSPILMEAVDDKGKSIQAKDTRSLSQLWRAKVWKYWSKRPEGLTFDDFYERMMQRMLQVSDEICEMYGENDNYRK